MRRLALALMVCALALLGASSAVAAKPRLVVANGSTHVAGRKLTGWFVVANRGGARSAASTASASVRGGKPPKRVLVVLRLRRATIPPPSNLTPTTLFVWLHGCGGDSEGDAWVVDPGAEEDVPQDWMTLSLGGRDGGCWNPLAETEPLVMAAIADFETHFNVNRRRVILGGYSSGGDLAYRTGFFHSSTFAGLLIENSSPFRETEASEAELLGAATTKLPIVHLAHAEDETYELDEVEPEIAAVRAAGFPVEFIVRPGGHSDSHTNPDLLTYLLPHIDDGWLAP